MSNKSTIGSFAKVRRGASPRPISDQKYFGGNVGWIRISDVTASNKYLRKTEQYVSPLGESLSVRVDKGDLVMSICGTIGRPIIIDFPSCIHDGFVQLYEITNADTEYLYYILQYHEKDLENKGQPGTQVNLNTGIVENFEIFFPPLPTQRKIAHILSTADAVIEKTQAAIAKYKAIKQGMLHDLFTRGIDLKTNKLRPKYQDAPHLYKPSKLGWIPNEWEVERFEGLTVEAILGITVRGASNTTTNIPLLKMGNLIWGELVLNHVELVRYSTIDNDRFLLKYRDFLFNTRNTPELVGKTTIWRDEFPIATFDNNLLRIRFKKGVASPFVCYFMSFGQGRNNIKSLVDGTTSVAAVYWKNLKGYNIVLPEEKEQEEIVRRLEQIDNKIQTEQTYLHKLQQIKAGLMADLLSGKKQVIV